MALQRTSFSKSATPIIYYEHSLKQHFFKRHSSQHHSKWFTASISVIGLSLAWWLSQSNASYEEQIPEYQVLGFDASSLASPVASFPTLSDVFFNRMGAEISDWIKQANVLSAQQNQIDTLTNLEASHALQADTNTSAPATAALKALSEETQKIEKPSANAAKTVHSMTVPAETITTDPKTDWQTLTVEKGDTLSNLFSRHEIRRADLYRLLKLKTYKKPLTRLRPGQEILVKTNTEGHLLALKSKLNYQEDLLIETANNDIGFAAKVLQRPIVKRLVSKAAVIEHSLFADARNAGLSSKKILDLTRVFNWDIDFSQDLRKGDHFSVVYEAMYYDDEQVKEGTIVAAEFVNQGISHQAVRYTDPSGHTAYYTPDGHSLQKAFIRNPLKIGRVTSKFNLARRHPILNKIRAHKGVDYGAPTGTPIYATGKGKVIFAGRKNGYGNIVILEHWDKYTTLYAHLSGFAKGLKVGKKVNQEQEIGYVGQTGLATGPHLHYEFRINGEHKDPLTVKLPKAIPIEAKYKQDFLAKTKTLIAKLDQATQVALLRQ